VALALPAAAPADVDVSEYQAGGVVRSEAERRALHEQFERERAAEAAREAERQASLRREAEAEAAREAARPYPERLTRQRCTLCHQATHFSQQRHTRIGWALVVKRMVHFNHAPIPADEQPVIVAYLAAAYPAGVEEKLIEYGLPIVALLGIGGIAWGGRRLFARWQRTAGKETT
jgi:uncharacterized paraquat-inducible protein A